MKALYTFCQRSATLNLGLNIHEIHTGLTQLRIANQLKTRFLLFKSPVSRAFKQRIPGFIKFRVLSYSLKIVLIKLTILDDCKQQSFC